MFLNDRPHGRVQIMKENRGTATAGDKSNDLESQHRLIKQIKTIKKSRNDTNLASDLGIKWIRFFVFLNHMKTNKIKQQGIISDISFFIVFL